MSYLYTRANRLEEPHSYMYTPFQGVSLLQAYHVSRLEFIGHLARHGKEFPGADRGYEDHSVAFIEACFESISRAMGDRFRQMLAPPPQNAEPTNLNVQADILPAFSVAECVVTLDLLSALISALLLSRHETLTKLWLDRLVQRFEVTKKIYESYRPGFRKAEGSSKVIRLYWLFALALSVYYAKTQQLKYLSTLLKVNDLLCSLPEELHTNCLSSSTMSAIVATEIISIERVTEERGIRCG